MKLDSDDLDAVRDALLKLPSSGRSGFEGLLATIFVKLLIWSPPSMVIA